MLTVKWRGKYSLAKLQGLDYITKPYIEFYGLAGKVLTHTTPDTTSEARAVYIQVSYLTAHRLVGTIRSIIASISVNDKIHESVSGIVEMPVRDYLNGADVKSWVATLASTLAELYRVLRLSKEQLSGYYERKLYYVHKDVVEILRLL